VSVLALTSQGAPAPLPRPDPSKDDLKRMQGEWLLRTSTVGGKSIFRGRQAIPIRVVIAGNRMTRKVSRGGERWNRTEWTITLDARQKPKALDMTPITRTTYAFRCVYSLERDKLVVCDNGPGAAERPRDLAGNQPGRYREVYQRVKR
jgi:uncharacterized protein (TIGR03067 family)